MKTKKQIMDYLKDSRKAVEEMKLRGNSGDDDAEDKTIGAKEVDDKLFKNYQG